VDQLRGLDHGTQVAFRSDDPKRELQRIASVRGDFVRFLPRRTR
jgi:hypothetical protein